MKPSTTPPLNIWAIVYSHSGQSRQALEAFCSALPQEKFRVWRSEIVPEKTIPFPWNPFEFFNAFPETVQWRPLLVRLDPEPDFTMHRPAALIFCFPPWFLTPALPFVSFLKSEYFSKIPKDIPVLVLMTCRNMWMAAMDDIKEILGDRLAGFLVLEDPHPNVVSLFTTLRWLLRGKQRLFGTWGPRAGVNLPFHGSQIRAAASVLEEALEKNEMSQLHPRWLELGAARIKPSLLLMEMRGRKNFARFAWFIQKSPTPKARRFRVQLLAILLPLAVLVLSPIMAIQKAVLQRTRASRLRRLCRVAASLKPLPEGTFEKAWKP